MKRRNFLGLAAVSLVLSGTSSLMAANKDLRITLTGAGRKGTAKYRDRSGSREFQVEGENLRVPQGTVLTVAVNGGTVGAMTVTPLRNARLSLNTKLGQVVPVISAGALVTVVGPDGTILLSGRF